MTTPPATMQPTPGTPFYVLQAFVNNERDTRGGCICPVCTANNKLKRYSLQPLHFRMMEKLLVLGVERPAHWKQIVDRDENGDPKPTKMLQITRYYGVMVSRTVNTANPHNRSGEWCITRLGAAFMQGECRLPLCCWVIHDRVLWWSFDTADAATMQENASEQHFSTLVEEMSRSQLLRERAHDGGFRVLWRGYDY